MTTEPTAPDPFDDEGPDESRGGERKGREGGIVERAIRRLSDRREIVLWEGQPVEPGPELAYSRDPSGLRGEKIRTLRTELLMRLGMGKTGAPFALLGAAPNEGRSLLCAELAMAFAQLGSKTLLVDANLREPGLARLFQGAVSSMGLTEVLLGRTANLPLHRVIGPPHLALLTAGTPPPNPVDLLSGPQFERLVRDWSRTYEFVLIDTPATSLRSDGIVIANAVRNVVLVARRDKTKYSEIGDLKHRLEATGARIVGAVINDF